MAGWEWGLPWLTLILPVPAPGSVLSCDTPCLLKPEGPPGAYLWDSSEPRVDKPVSASRAGADVIKATASSLLGLGKL